MKRITPETSLKKAIKDALNAFGYFHYPNTQGLGSYKGIPDITAMKYQRVLQIEVKKPNGKQSPHQKQFQAAWEAKGGIYLLIDNIDDFLKELKAYERDKEYWQ